ncbi:MAG: hypothetical protein IBX60_07765 [Candidatus Aminicenantes bacterium]|nr:hypothetical protein [Candidatus Aminicenantes bacterium]
MLNKKKLKFDVRFYEGYKGKEVPRSVIIGNREFKIEKILSRKRTIDNKTGQSAEVFLCSVGKDIYKITVYEGGDWEITFSHK